MKGGRGSYKRKSVRSGLRTIKPLINGGTGPLERIPLEFKALVELCERLEKTTKRNVMIDVVADFLGGLSEEEIEPAISMMLGRAFPKYDPRTLDVSWATLSKIIRRLSGVDWATFNTAFRSTGDVGAATQIVFERRAPHRQSLLFEKPLTILEARRILEHIAELKGQRSR